MKPNAEKSKATKLAKKESFAEQTVVIDENWHIIRADELNWEIQFKGKFHGYFGRLSHALKAIPHKMLNVEARGSLIQIVAILQSIEARIDQCVSNR